MKHECPAGYLGYGDDVSSSELISQLIPGRSQPLAVTAPEGRQEGRKAGGEGEA